MKMATWSKTHAWVLLLCGIIGLIASFTLTLETIRVNADPNYVPSCSISPILGCVSVMKSDPGTFIADVPNPLFGVILFSMLVAFSTLALFRTDFPRRIWQLGLIAATIGFVFVHYLILESVFILKSLCPWCMVTWTIVAPIFVIFLAKNLEITNRPLKGLRQFILGNYPYLLALWYGMVLFTVGYEFWSYWKTLL